MLEIQGNIWDYHPEHWIVITTNGSIRKDGACVMGRGVAREARDKFPKLPYELGERLVQNHLRVEEFLAYRLLAFPVKYQWGEKANLGLIAQSAWELAVWRKRLYIVPSQVAIVRPGCGNGGLSWAVVKPVLEKYLDDRFIVIEKG